MMVEDNPLPLNFIVSETSKYNNNASLILMEGEIFMILDLVNIINACNTLHNAEAEANKKFFFKKRKELKEINNQKILIKQKIMDLYNDEWNTEYLFNLEQTIFAYNQILEYANPDVSIPEYVPGMEIDPKKFYPIYFLDKKNDNKERIIILEIVGENIDLTIFDPKTGSSFCATSNHKIQKSQKRIENVCKHLLINVILDYLGV